jgi:alanyl-tRNA synthetase
MMESVQRVARVVKDEEHRYATTFLVAEKVFTTNQIGLVGGVIPGASRSSSTTPTAWRSTSRKTWRASAGLAIDREGFDREMEQQRERARASWKGAEKGAVAPAYQKLLEKGRTKFLGYDELDATSRVIGLLVGPAAVDEIPAGATAELVLDQTPFYAETGGQVGDRGSSIRAERATKWPTWKPPSPPCPA